MEYRAKESSSRKLVWVEGQKESGWGCSNCAWVFHLSNLPSSNSLDQLTARAQRQLEDDFDSHDCAAHPRSEAAAS
jgi:hypothetical protein